MTKNVHLCGQSITLKSWLTVTCDVKQNVANQEVTWLRNEQPKYILPETQCPSEMEDQLLDLSESRECLYVAGFFFSLSGFSVFLEKNKL